MLRSTKQAAKAAGRPRRAGGTGRTRARPARVLAVVAAAALASGAAACGSSTSSSSGSKGSVVFADVAPFSGPDAALGPAYLVSCEGTAQAINKAGGILGKTVSCTSADTKGDPADAVPAVGSLLSRTPNLALVIGCTSDEAAAVVPVISSHKTVMFCMTGQLEFDHVHFPYFYRLVPPDASESYAMVVIAEDLHYKRIALAFGNDIGSQTFVQPAITAIGKAGMTLVANETLDLNATTFRTEAEKIVQAHPDAIMTEALGAADPTLFAEIKQLNGGKMIPIIGTSAAILPAFYQASAKAVGAADFAANFHADNLVGTATGGAAYQTFKQALLAVKGKVANAQVGNFSTYFGQPGAVHLYDGMNLAALAMVAAGSTDTAKWQPYIISIADGVPGAVVVNSFAQGVRELKAGKKIRFIGPGGATGFDSFHDSPGLFIIQTYSATGAVQVSGNISPAQYNALAGG